MMASNTFACPNCGEMLPANARVCRYCGSDENTGWSDNTYLDGIDLPFDDDDYEEIKAKEFPSNRTRTNGKRARARVDYKMIIGATVAAAMLYALVLRGC